VPRISKAAVFTQWICNSNGTSGLGWSRMVADGLRGLWVVAGGLRDAGVTPGGCGWPRESAVVLGDFHFSYQRHHENQFLGNGEHQISQIIFREFRRGVVNSCRWPFRIKTIQFLLKHHSLR
jgi:hypothetical protein